MTTRIQWVFNRMDSQQNKSVLQRLSFVCRNKGYPRRVYTSRVGRVVTSEDPSHDAFINSYTEYSVCLLDYVCKTKSGIALL